jgi:hypothetical protein
MLVITLISGELYLIQHYVIKLVRDLWKVGGFLRVLRFPSLIFKTDRRDITGLLLKKYHNNTNPVINLK